MKQEWTPDELTEHFTLQEGEHAFVRAHAPHTTLGKALLLKWFQYAAQFPPDPADIPPAVVAYMAQQLDVPAQVFAAYKWHGRRIKDHRKAIRAWCGFRTVTLHDQAALRDWLTNNVLPDEYRPAHLEDRVYQRLRTLHIEPPSPKQVQRLITSVLHRYEEAFFHHTAAQLSAAVRARLYDLMQDTHALDMELPLDGEVIRYAPFQELKVGAGRPNVQNIKRVCARLTQLQQIALPPDLFAGIPWPFLRHYRQHIAVASPSHLQRRLTDPRGEAQTLAMLAAFCWVREREITDNVVDLLLRILKDMRVRAQYHAEKRLLHDLTRVNGKHHLLFRLARLMVDHPHGIIQDILYPAVGETRLHALVEEAQHAGVYQQSVQVRITASYAHHYRQILPSVLAVLQFRSQHAQYQSLITALHLVETYMTRKDAYYPLHAHVPLHGVIQKQWHPWIYQVDPAGRSRIRRARYEVCVLQALGEKLRCKEIWVDHADRYRNPAEDVPADFKDQRTQYYAALQLPMQPTAFLTPIKESLHHAVQTVHDTLPQNDAVKILDKAGGWISIRPAAAQVAPITLHYLKHEIKRRWWMTSLLDVLKEVDLRVGFTNSFASLTGQQRLSHATLQRRLLLCIFGLGTNTGLSSVSMGDHGVLYHQLQYTRRRFISTDGLRHAIGQVVDATFAIKSSHIWGDTTTWCAADSKQFGAWSQNLRAQWHKRYRQAGIMVYWHVARQSICIYSQLKAPSSSEVASMIEGVLRHCTAMQVDRTYVDTHGQSEVAFAFCHLLGFQLMPRFKQIQTQKLSLPDQQMRAQIPRLHPIVQQAIDWTLIAREYDAMVQYATAIRLGTATTEAILQRFTRHNHQHPTYKALSELGRALKTIFLCQYLLHEAVRIEIDAGLNVVEQWNSTNNFIFYGHQGEVRSNDVDAQEIAILSMHLLQACLVYINTLMIQEVLTEPAWYNRMTEADWRGLTPLFYLHVNPYGHFDLDLTQRIPLAS